MYFAVGYKYTKSSKRGKNFPLYFFIISLRKMRTLANLRALYFSMLGVLDAINKSKP